MSDSTLSPAPSDTKPPKRGRRAVWISALVVAAGVAGVAAASAFGNGPGFGPGFGFHGHRGFGGPMQSGQIEDRADRMVRHAAIELDASNEQQDKLRAIVKGALKDILPMRDKAQAALVAAQRQIDVIATQKQQAQAALDPRFGTIAGKPWGDSYHVTVRDNGFDGTLTSDALQVTTATRWSR